MKINFGAVDGLHKEQRGEELYEDFDDELNDSECYGVLFWDEDGTECPLTECTVRISCKRLCKLAAPKDTSAKLKVRDLSTPAIQRTNKKASGPHRKKHEHSKYQLTDGKGGDDLFVQLRDLLALNQTDVNWNARSRYFNGVLPRHAKDKPPYRVLRAWPHVRSLHVDVVPSFARELAKDGWHIEPFSEAKSRVLKPHYGYVKLRTEDSVDEFARAFISWRKTARTPLDLKAEKRIQEKLNE